MLYYGHPIANLLSYSKQPTIRSGYLLCILQQDWIPMRDQEGLQVVGGICWILPHKPLNRSAGLRQSFRYPLYNVPSLLSKSNGTFCILTNSELQEISRCKLILV